MFCYFNKIYQQISKSSAKTIKQNCLQKKTALNTSKLPDISKKKLISIGVHWLAQCCGVDKNVVTSLLTRVFNTTISTKTSKSCIKMLKPLTCIESKLIFARRETFRRVITMTKQQRFWRENNMLSCYKCYKWYKSPRKHFIPKWRGRRTAKPFYAMMSHKQHEWSLEWSQRDECK